jgi:hypothetical protein
MGWWMWLIIASGLAVGIAGYPSGFPAAIGISLAKALFIVAAPAVLGAYDRNAGSSDLWILFDGAFPASSAMESCGGNQR